MILQPLPIRVVQVGIYRQAKFCNLPMEEEFVHQENLFYGFLASVYTPAMVENVGKPSGLKAFTQVSSLKNYKS